MNTHTEACLAEVEESLRLQDSWKAKWPNACKSCRSIGTVSTSDWVPYGSGSTEMVGEEFCEDCIGAGKCPRCGGALPEDETEYDQWWDNQDPCPHCGWTWGAAKDDCLPDAAECSCGYYDGRKFDKFELDPADMPW